MVPLNRKSAAPGYPPLYSTYSSYGNVSEQLIYPASSKTDWLTFLLIVAVGVRPARPGGQGLGLVFNVTILEIRFAIFAVEVRFRSGCGVLAVEEGFIQLLAYGRCRLLL